MTAVHAPSTATRYPAATLPEIRDESLGGSPLARAAIAGDAPDGWYVPRPAGAGWRARVDATRPRDDAWLRELAPAIDARGAAAERLARVARDRGVLVTTGQQPGLFGGPLYTWHKALTALAVAYEIERCTGVPAAPLFWAATDDTDFVEAAWTVVAGAEGAETLRLDDALASGDVSGAMMSEIALGDVGAQFDALARAAGSAADARPLEAAREAYAPDATVGSAYVTLLRALLEPLGIAVLDASHAAVAEHAHPHLRRALECAPQVADALRTRDAEIERCGFSTQVAAVPGLSLVFERTRPGKRRIPIAEASQRAERIESGLLSPNVLLRPVIERAIVPTVAYIAGPGEISYFAQSSAVATALGLDVPLALPRWSGTIIEPRVRQAVETLGLAIDDLSDAHAAERRVARSATPPATGAAAERLQVVLSEALGELRVAIPADGVPVPLAAVDGLERDLAHRLARFDRRLLAAVKRAECERMAQLARARDSLHPIGRRQERALNAIPLLARHGMPLLDAVLARARDHARALVG